MAALDGIIKKLHGEDDDPAPMGMPGTAKNPNTGIAGNLASFSAPFSAPSADPMPASPLADAPKPSGVFQSPNTSVRGYLDEAMRAFAPQVKSIADEAGRKSAVENYTRSLLPEIQKRGGSLSDIRGENATVDGRIIDFFRDIEGAADPQYLDKTDEVRGGGGAAGARPMFAGSSIAPLLQGDAQSGIQQALSQFGQAQDGGFLSRLLAQLQGGQG